MKLTSKQKAVEKSLPGLKLKWFGPGPRDFYVPLVRIRQSRFERAIYNQIMAARRKRRDALRKKTRR